MRNYTHFSDWQNVLDHDRMTQFISPSDRNRRAETARIDALVADTEFSPPASVLTPGRVAVGVLGLGLLSVAAYYALKPASAQTTVTSTPAGHTFAPAVTEPLTATPQGPAGLALGS